MSGKRERRSMRPTRRDVLKSVTMAGAGLAVARPGQATGQATESAAARQEAPQRKAGQTSMMGVRFEGRPTVRLGLIGVGARGGGMLNNWLAIDGVEITAVCDVVPEKAQEASSRIEKKGFKAPALYTNGERDFERMCTRDDLDVVYIATPWDWHVPMAVAAMKNGIHAAAEVPAAETLEECWTLVDTSEQTRRHCIMLENCCYGRSELLVLNMVKAGLFGELLHGGAGYVHDLRALLFRDESEGLWRRAEHIGRNGNLYPTHGLGPVANYMDINRGDRFETLVSMSSPSLGLQVYREANVPKDNPKWKEQYACGDRNISLLKTAQGRVIRLEHDVSSPHPYDRINLIAGTKGIFTDYPPRFYFDGQEPEEYRPIEEYTQYEHDLWKRVGELARKLGGHGGMDFITCYRLMECMQQGLAPDMDVYDAATWSAPAALSEASVQQGSAPVAFPDFTRGQWQESREFVATATNG
jgi:hypothetical protein